MTDTAQFEIRLPQFEGPFDLLLFFIERDELDIYDIPISKITNDFLEYIHRMSAMNIELASEFILVAATLMRIKVRMLLPRPELDDAGNEVDPRQDLVQRLLEYKKYKSVLSDLQNLEDERQKQERRGNIIAELQQIAKAAPAGEELHTVDLYKLLMVYEKVINKFKNEQLKPRHTVIQYPYSIEDQKKAITEMLALNNKADFEQVLNMCRDKVQVVYAFLAILEMLQQQLIDIRVGLGYNNFWISIKEAA